MQLLEMMPTDSQIVQQLKTVIQSKSPFQGMRHLLIGTGTAERPARLLYTLQVLRTALLLESGILVESLYRYHTGE